MTTQRSSDVATIPTREVREAMTADPAVSSPGVLLYKVADAARLLNMSRTLIFEQLRAGRLASVKQGRTRLIPATALQDYVELLVKESHEVA